MKLSILLDGEEKPLEVSGTAPDVRFQFGTSPWRQALVEAPEPGVYSILLDGRVFDAHVERGQDCLIVTIDGRRFEIEVRDPRRWSREGRTRGQEGRQTIASPMPGRVVRVLVQPGDEVRAGQGIVVVEAMKMQNEMRAVKAGRVAGLSAREGAAVAAGEVLATIE